MPIKRRSTPEERATKLLGTKYKSCLRHPYLQALVRFGKYNTSPINIMRAIEETRGWKGPSYADKVFVYLLCSIMWRGHGESYLTDSNFDKLRKHLEEHAQDILDKHGVLWHGIMLWDERQLRRFNKNDMLLPKPKRAKVKLTEKPKVKRRRKLKPK